MGKVIALSLSIIAIGVIFGMSPLFKLNLDKPLNSNYVELPPTIEFEGNLKQNNLLQKSVYIGHNKAKGPETVVFTPDGSLYTGLLNGQIVRIDEENNVHKIVQIGEETDENICNGDGSHSRAYEKCGRPLGLRLRENSYTLYVADSYYGILKVDLKTGEKTSLVKSNDERFGDKPLRFTNDLDIDGDIIYFIDTSYSRGFNEVLEEHTEAHPRGRLFSYNEKTNELIVLFEGLYFPNGLQLTPNKDSLLINENSMSRITKFHLTGDKKGTTELFVNLPGFGDTIRLTDRQTLLAPLAIPRVSILTSILDLAGKFPSLRNFVGATINLQYFYLLSPKYGLVVEYDMNGNLLKSWHDPTGEVVECATSAVLHNNKVYIGTIYASYIAVVDY